MTETTSKTSNHDMSDIHRAIGAELHAERKRQGLDKKTISRRLRLPGIVIDDLEAGQLERLSGIYRRGHVRNYANLLGLDAEAMVSRMAPEAPPDLQPASVPGRRGWRLEQYLRIATYVLVTTAIVPPLLYFFIEGGSRILEREPENGEGRIEVSESSDRQSGADEPESVEPRHVAAATLPLPPRRREAEVDLSAVNVLPEAVTEAPSPLQVEDDLRSLTIEIREDSWIEIYDGEGERLEYDLLRAGEKRDYRAQPPFSLLLGQANAVELMLEGEAVVWDGQNRGDVTRLEILADGEVRR